MNYIILEENKEDLGKLKRENYYMEDIWREAKQLLELMKSKKIIPYENWK